MYQKLFEPMKINQCEIPNRLAVTAMVTNYCDESWQTEQQGCKWRGTGYVIFAYAVPCSA